MPGSPMSDEDALSYARKNFPYGNFCLVRDWMWLDIETTDAQRHALEKAQCQSASKTFQVAASKSFQSLRCFSRPFCAA
ncbi:hypothetical protein D9M70_322770 [compost metagenome]